MPAGRKSAYDTIIEKNLAWIKKWKSLGATDAQICEKLKIHPATFYKYLKEKSDFAEALKEGKDDLIIDLKDNLATLARKHTLETKKTYIKKDIETGQTTQYTEITTREVDGNVSAIHLLLKNLDKDGWKEDWDNYALKQQEMELRKLAAENKEWQ